MGNVAKYQHGRNMTFTVVELLMIIPKSTYLSISLPYFSIYHFFSLTLRVNSFEMAKKFTYKTQGTCSKSIEIELEGDIVKSVRFEGGCHGNTQGIGLLTRGMQAADVIARLEGIDCKGRGTSCPDQLAKALRQALGQ